MTTATSSTESRRKPRLLTRGVARILVSICLACAGNALLTTEVSLHLGLSGFRPDAVTIILTAFPMGFLVGCLAAKIIVLRLGHERTFLVATVLTAMATLAFAAGNLAPVWFALRLINGFSMAVLFIVAESWINLYADQSNRGGLFSLYMMMTSLGVLLGQVMAGLGDPHTTTSFLIAGGTIIGGLLAGRFGTTAWPALPAHAAHSDAPDANKKIGYRSGLLKVLAIAPVTVVASLQCGMTNMNIYALTPFYGVQLGLPTTTAVALITTFSIGGLLAQSPAGWLSDNFDRRVILLAQGGLAALLCGLIAILGNSLVAVLFVLFFIYGAVTLTIYPVAIAFANGQLESRYMVSVSGTLLLLYSFGNIFTPGASTALMTRFFPQTLFLLLGSGALLVMLAAAFNLRRRLVSIPPHPLPEIAIPPAGVNQ